MALFTDGAPSTIEDLTAQDAQLLTVSNVEGIDVTQKLALAWNELGLELYALLDLFGTADQMFCQPPRPDLGTVVVTAPLSLWHTFRTLERVYADAYNCQVNDRYAGKRDYYHDRAGWAEDRLREIGVGIAAVPVAKALTPTLSNGPAAPALPDGTYYTTMAWVNRNGEEGAAADPASISLTGSAFSVLPGPTPQNASGWNVYAGSDPNGLTLQNDSPLAPGQTWVQQSPVTTAGRAPGTGQPPSFLRVIPRAIQRG